MNKYGLTPKQTFIMDRYFKLRGTGADHREALQIARCYAYQIKENKK